MCNTYQIDHYILKIFEDMCLKKVNAQHVFEQNVPVLFAFFITEMGNCSLSRMMHHDTEKSNNQAKSTCKCAFLRALCPQKS